jgi:bifunctional non-homologous end joining protein LigD
MDRLRPSWLSSLSKRRPGGRVAARGQMDGYRIVATIIHGKVRRWSRKGIEWTDKVPELAEAVASLKLDSAPEGLAL